MHWKYIYVRQNEYPYTRTLALITPDDVAILTQHGIHVYVEQSNDRIYDDVEYLEKGGILTNEPWYSPVISSKNSLVVGWAIPNVIDHLHEHNHMCISNIFAATDDTRSTLYDYNHITSSPCPQIAGYVACGLGLSQIFVKRMGHQSVRSLGQWETKIRFRNQIAKIFEYSSWLPVSIGIIGIDTHYGKGVVSLLDDFELDYISVKSQDTTLFDILFYCGSCESDLSTLESSVLVDVASHPNHPFIHLYTTHTTLAEPVKAVSESMDVIALDNYCLLLPKYTSDEISKTLVKIFTENSPPAQ
jgi:hypothetical protein